MKIDTHQHFWDVSKGTYPWMNDAVAPLRRTFGPSDLAPQLASNDVTATVAVQARAELVENRFLLGLAAENEFLSGVVGWVDLENANVGDVLDEVLGSSFGSRFVGVRHQVEEEADDHWLGRPEVVRGLGEVARRDLAYDLLIQDRQIPATLRTLDALPDAKFVLDHFAKPAGDPAQFDHWRDGMRALAARPNVYSKWSGFAYLTASGDSVHESLGKYFETLLEEFGVERMMFGSDWPVCTLHRTYSEVAAFTDELLGELSVAERSAILGDNAAIFYRLTV